tara:strand:- start:930 stop:1055 length:126 start_codon:yes stop_codon:yes gene_type:complete
MANKNGLDAIKEKAIKMPDSDIKKRILKDLKNKSKNETVTK